jgi:hypothetical protein
MLPINFGALGSGGVELVAGLLLLALAPAVPDGVTVLAAADAELLAGPALLVALLSTAPLLALLSTALLVAPPSTALLLALATLLDALALLLTRSALLAASALLPLPAAVESDKTTLEAVSNGGGKLPLELGATDNIADALGAELLEQAAKSATRIHVTNRLSQCIRDLLHGSRTYALRIHPWLQPME